MTTEELLESLAGRGAPNLDAMTHEEIVALAEADPAQVGATLWPERKRDGILYATGALLKLFAIWRADAMKALEGGHPKVAEGLERECDLVHSHLPEWAKWTRR